MPSTTFVARRPGPFSALAQAAEVGGLRLAPLAPARVTDRYYDTETGDLLRRGLALRVREHDGRRTAGLRAAGDAEAGPLPDDLDLDGADRNASEGPDDAPELAGALGAAVRAAAGGGPLALLLTVRQYRTPRVAYDGAQAVGVVSFDVVVVETPGARTVSNEVEVRPHAGADPLARLAPAFAERGLEPTARSRFERGVLRCTRTLDQPALLLPDELRRLEAAAAGADPAVARPARSVLLDARGFRPDTIAAQTGSSMARVRRWRERFREVRLGVLDPELPPARRPPSRPPAARPARSSAEAAASREPSSQEPSRSVPMSSAPPPRPPHLDPPSPPPGPPPFAPGGDGAPGADVPADMAELLDLFAPSHPDTPVLDADALLDELDDEDQDAADDDDRTEVGSPSSGRPDSAPTWADRGVGVPYAVDANGSPGDGLGGGTDGSRLNPYPVVLGPVRAGGFDAAFPVGLSETAGPAVDFRADASQASGPAHGPAAEPRRDPFAEVDLRTLRRPPSAAAGQPGGTSDAGLERPALDGGTPLARAVHESLAHALAEFEGHGQTFLASHAPSDARRLLVAAQQLRLTAETFGGVLPAAAAQRLTAGLRLLAADLGTALDHACAAALAPHRADLPRLAASSLASAARRLDGARHRIWADRARRLLTHLDAQRALGLRLGDFADAPPDDYVGQPGDVPTPTRLRHVLGSEVWGRFEAVRAVEDDLGAVTPDLAAHLAVALSGLRFVLGLAAAAGPAASLDAALGAAEREVTRARHRAVGAALAADDTAGTVADALAVVPGVWAEVTGDAFRGRLAAVVASI